MSTTKKKGGYVSKFLKKADRAIDKSIKKADKALDEAIEFSQKTAKDADKTKKILESEARKRASALKIESSKRISEGLSAAKKLATKQENFALLEKLDTLRKSGVITETEFRKKKKEILDRI